MSDKKDYKQKNALQILKKSEYKFGATTFFAKLHAGDTCGSNGLPLTPNSIVIYGRAQELKTIRNRYLCRYLDIIRGKHERTIIVSQYSGKPLSECYQLETLNPLKIAYQIIVGLNLLHSKEIIHRNLNSENILLQENGDIKLFNYGLYNMTDCGRLVSFPIIQSVYAAPEVYLARTCADTSNQRVDIWSLGILLTELVLKQSLWTNINLGQKIRKILSLLQCNNSIFERICREHNRFDVFESLDSDLKQLIEDCLNIHPIKRPDTNQLLNLKMFEEFRLEEEAINKPKFDPFTIDEFYHWWQLAGGDIFQELKKQGLIRSSAPILSLPSIVLLDGTSLGKERNPAMLYDPKVIEISSETLYERFKHLTIDQFYPLVHSHSCILSNNEAYLKESHRLPLVIREKNPEYQFHRIVLMRRLLHGYPFTQNQIIKEAERDIPPLLRGEIWSALLGVKGNYQLDFEMIDKETPTITDRQIEVDIPRCHQYNELLSSCVGHIKLKRILKAWVYKNSHYVYWQGLDSLTAPFLYLNFNDEAKAFACLSLFIPKYLHKFFLKDNSVIIQEYLAKFSQLIAFHDPVLANHLYNINFIPELFAIPWFLTMFSHVFPLHKILHLWDKLLLGDSSFPLHIGLSVLTQLRPLLLNSGFNECILLFSDLPEVDIERCLQNSMETYNNTPKSITRRFHQNNHEIVDNDILKLETDVKALNKERCPRIDANDVVSLIKTTPESIICVDIRNPTQFNRNNILGSINIPFTNVKFTDNDKQSLGVYQQLLTENIEKSVVIVGSEDTDLALFPIFLLNCNVARVCLLNISVNVLQTRAPTIFTN